MFDTGFWSKSNTLEEVESKDPETQEPSGRPKIGIALGGGAACGWAHIGVMKTLIKHGYEPTVISGTSIGSVVGGCYSAGKLDDLEQFARELSKRRLFGLLDLTFAGSGLINGNRLANLLEAGLKGIEIQALKKKFIAIATELGTGHEIWLTKGRLVNAMRASYAIPGIFKPVKVHGRWLIDGAVVNPVPVSVCRAFGSRLVIAVNLNNDAFGRGTICRSHDDLDTRIPNGKADDTDEEAPESQHNKSIKEQFFGSSGDGPPGISTVMFDAYNIVQDRIARSRLAGDPPDITISPQLGQIGLFDFHKAAQAIEIGIKATETQLNQIERAVVALS